MTLQAFTESRLFRAGGKIFKFNIRAGSSLSGEEVIRGNQEMENIIRTVLGNLDNLQPFSSTHFNIFPYKKRWEGLPKVLCSHQQKRLTAYPFVLILYLEKSGKQAGEKLSLERGRVQLSSGYEPQPKRCKTDSPLEEAILKDLLELEAEGKVSTVGLDTPHAEGEVQDPGHKNKEEEEEEEERERVGPRRPAGILSQLARRFPFSLFFRNVSTSVLAPSK